MRIYRLGRFWVMYAVHAGLSLLFVFYKNAKYSLADVTCGAVLF